MKGYPPEITDEQATMIDAALNGIGEALRLSGEIGVAAFVLGPKSGAHVRANDVAALVPMLPPRATADLYLVAVRRLARECQADMYFTALWDREAQSPELRIETPRGVWVARPLLIRGPGPTAVMGDVQWELTNRMHVVIEPEVKP